MIAPGAARAALAAAIGMAGSGVGVRHDPSWTHGFDFDGDGDQDVVTVEFTGGAHCCYRLAVHLSSTAHTYRLPFLLDGGYVGGLDLSQPERFSIRQTVGALPEILMEIGTYDGEPQALPAEWRQRYGIRTHHITVSFQCGQLRVRDQSRSR